MRTVFILERNPDPAGTIRARILSVSNVPAAIPSDHVAELLGSCRRVTDRHDFHLDELGFGDEVLL